jgi:hypothetical protein
MLRLFLALGLLFAAAIPGCGMCQDCHDYSGPVPQSENFGDFHNTPRSGSAVAGLPAGAVQGEPVLTPDAEPDAEPEQESTVSTRR